MQTLFDGEFYKIIRITGSQDNFLGLCLSDVEHDIEVLALPIKNGDSMKINAGSILAQVKNGIISASKELGKMYFVSKIQFIPSDSPSDTIYEYLTIELLKKIDQGTVGS